MIGLSKYEREDFDRFVLAHGIALPVYRDDTRDELRRIWLAGKGNYFGGAVLYAGQALRTMCKLLRVRPSQLPLGGRYA